jgi:hypothetical protein
MQAALKESHASPNRTMRVSEHRTKDDMLILATNRFCDIDGHNRLSLDQFSEAFNLLIGQVSPATRQIVARRLAHCPFTPRAAALYLALEPIAVAMPILAHCETLGQLDLLRIIDRTEIGHARAIATRLDIGPSLIRQLKTLRDEKIEIALEDNDALIGNLERLSSDSLFAEIDAREEHLAMENQLEAPSINSELDSEPDQPPEQELQSDAAATPTPAPAPLNAAEHALLAAAGRGSNLEMPPMASPMENEFHFGDAFEKVARARSHQGMAVLMQKRFNLALDTAQRVLQDKSGDTLAVLLSAANVKPAQANRIQLLTNATIGLSSHNALRAARFFDQLNCESSLRAVEQWPKAKDPQIRHEGQMQDGRNARDGGSVSPQDGRSISDPALQATG